MSRRSFRGRVRRIERAVAPPVGDVPDADGDAAIKAHLDANPDAAAALDELNRYANGPDFEPDLELGPGAGRMETENATIRALIQDDRGRGLISRIGAGRRRRRGPSERG